MPPLLFFSYSHKDEDLRDELEIRLAALKRQKLIESWHDRRIVVGSELGATIDTHLERASVILLLISPDFIASDYCYEREMTRALDRNARGEAHVIPVILRPCDWQDLSFGHLLATPKDGKPVTTWPNLDEAFLDVERAIKQALREITAGSMNRPSTVTEKTSQVPASTIYSESVRSSNLRVSKTFSDLERDQFLRKSFDYIARYFKGSLEELVRRDPSFNIDFRMVDANEFTAAIYLHGEKVCKGSAMIDGDFLANAVEYRMDDSAHRGGMNEAVLVESDSQKLYFKPLGMQFSRDRDEKLTAEGAAEFFWELFFKPLQQ